MINQLKRFWNFLKEDTFPSWIVSIILIIVFIKFILFPFLSLISGASLPLVIVESCSMYHDSYNFDTWWKNNGRWYEDRNISKSEFKDFPIKSGLNKGDIVIVTGYGSYKPGDIIIFDAGANYPLIHRIVSESPIATKGDNNEGQLTKANTFSQIDETSINNQQIRGKALIKIPLLGWIKLIFYEPFRSADTRGLCH